MKPVKREAESLCQIIVCECFPSLTVVVVNISDLSTCNWILAIGSFLFWMSEGHEVISTSKRFLRILMFIASTASEVMCDRNPLWSCFHRPLRVSTELLHSQLIFVILVSILFRTFSGKDSAFMTTPQKARRQETTDWFFFSAFCGCRDLTEGGLLCHRLKTRRPCTTTKNELELLSIC